MIFSVDSTMQIGDLFDLLIHDKNLVIVCATNRLARNLRLTFGQLQINNGHEIWPTPQTKTLDEWLNTLGEQVSLLGEISIEVIPNRVLTSFQECLVWKQSIEAVGKDNPVLPLFDLHSLAKTSVEAQELINTWNLRISDESGSEETQQFIGWRRQFNDTCQKQAWVTVTEYQKRIIGWLERGAGTLPSRVILAGFDMLTPHQQQLLSVLKIRGVEISNLELSTTQNGTTRVFVCDDAEAECRAAAAWAKGILQATPDARIGIVVADLEARRSMIVPIMDEALNPAALARADDTAARQYNVSLGLPLTRYGLIRTALALLRLPGCGQGMQLTEFGDLLRMPYWSADCVEANLRALVDATLRERPGQNLSVDTVLRIAATLDQSGDSKLLEHLKLLGDQQKNFQKVRKPSEWATAFSQILEKVGWPGERTLSSTEFQAREAFFEVLAAFAELDVILGAISIAAAIGELARLCKERIFQPANEGQPAVQVLGLIEAKGAEFDVLWIMGMNDQHWPPPARPNPLLPAELQRRQKTPGSSAEVQLKFALDIHRRLLHSAPHITFSYAAKEGERELRPSPLIAGLLDSTTHPQSFLASAMFGHVESENYTAMTFEYLDDHLAPPVAEGEKVSGGSGLLKAQAICPAWAFYRYRLGAKKLETPTEGFDASRRGTMVHAMLEVFWKQIKDSPSLNALSEIQLHETVAAAAEFALAQFELEQGEKLTVKFRQLETNRLQRLCLEWLEVDCDAARQPFRVVACEEKHKIVLGQLNINLVIDRVDELIENGRRIVLDYKTGSKIDTQTWQGDCRITEPQLPLYAAIVLAQPEHSPVAAVAFAKVRLRECEFQGVAAADNLLPDLVVLRAEVTLPPISNASEINQTSEELIDEWKALLDSWKQRLEAIADEIQRGEAAVRFENEQLLAYCEVLPLLRLTERKLQFEKGREGQQ